MIPLNVHNILDYVIGAVLILCPYVFGFAAVDAARDVFLVLGIGLIVYSLFTDYKYSLAKVIPLGVHMTMDVIAGLALMAAPYILNYRVEITGGQTFLHWILGLAAIALVAFTGRISKRGEVVDMTEETTDFRRAA